MLTKVRFFKAHQTCVNNLGSTGWLATIHSCLYVFRLEYELAFDIELILAKAVVIVFKFDIFFLCIRTANLLPKIYLGCY